MITPSSRKYCVLLVHPGISTQYKIRFLIYGFIFYLYNSFFQTMFSVQFDKYVSCRFVSKQLCLFWLFRFGSETPKQTYNIFCGFRETNRKSALKDWVSDCFGSKREILFVCFENTAVPFCDEAVSPFEIKELIFFIASIVDGEVDLFPIKFWKFFVWVYGYPAWSQNLKQNSITFN
jgi:hypothetical protein